MEVPLPSVFKRKYENVVYGVFLIFVATYNWDQHSLFSSMPFFPGYVLLRVETLSRIKSTQTRVFIDLKLPQIILKEAMKRVRRDLVGLSFWFVIPDYHTCRALVLNFPSVSLTSLSCAHLRVSASPPLFVKSWTSLAVWRAVS